MPLSAHERRVLAAIEDELNRHDPRLAELFAAAPATCDRTRPPPEHARIAARWAALPFALAVWAVVVVSGVGLVDAALIVVALVLLVGVHVARVLARREMYRRFAGDAYPDASPRED